MTGAEFVVKTLQNNGHHYVFGYPGGAIMPIYDALYGQQIEHILCRHEQGAAMAAIGYARASKSVGICFATSGPGATNLITGLADAMMDSIPIVAITGQVASSLIGTDAFQEIDVLGLSLACTKHSFLVTDPEQLPYIMEEAFKLAQAGRPGPVLIDIAKDVQLAEIPESALVSSFFPLDNHTIVPELTIQKANHLLAQSQRPILYLGGGIVLDDAVEVVREFTRHSQIPAVSTLKGLGVLQNDYPYYLGMLGMHGTRIANLAVQDCDLLMVVGARFDDRVTGKLDEFAPNARIIHIDIDAAELNKLRQTHVALQGSIRVILPQLTECLEIADWQSHILSEKIKHAWPYDHPGHAIYAPSLLKTLSERMPNTAIISTDVGQHQMWAAQHIDHQAPENFLTSAGLGTMGFGLPAAIGAQFSRPDHQSIVISGDGSIMMNIQELTTIKRFNLPVKIILLDNQRLGMVRQWQELFFDRRYSETILNDNPDFIALAQAFDIEGQTITTKAEVSAALNALLQSDRAYFLHVVISEQENVWPLVPPNTANQHMMEGSQ